MGKASRRRNATPTPRAPTRLPADVHPFFDSEFKPIELSDALRALESVKTMLLGVQEGALVEWNLGRKGTHISSHFVTADGVEDYLTSPNPLDDDFDSLTKAHLSRLGQLV